MPFPEAYPNGTRTNSEPNPMPTRRKPKPARTIPEGIRTIPEGIRTIPEGIRTTPEQIRRIPEQLPNKTEADPKNASKPPEMLSKIIEGKLRKWVNDITLLGQPFVKDDKQTVGKFAESHKMKLKGFTHWELGVH